MTEIQITHKREPVVTYPDKGHVNKVLKLQTYVPAYLNLTIISFVYQGPTSFDCIYAGMIIHEFQLNEFQESFSLCAKNTLLIISMTYFIEVFTPLTPLFWIVFYHHEEYSSLSVQLKASHSYCKGVKINTCEILTRGFQGIRSKSILISGKHMSLM